MHVHKHIYTYTFIYDTNYNWSRAGNTVQTEFKSMTKSINSRVLQWQRKMAMQWCHNLSGHVMTTESLTFSKETVCLLVVSYQVVMWTPNLTFHLSMQHLNAQCLWRPEEDVNTSETRVTELWAARWVQGLKPWSYGKAENALNCRAFSLVPIINSYGL